MKIELVGGENHGMIFMDVKNDFLVVATKENPSKVEVYVKGWKAKPIADQPHPYRKIGWREYK